MKVTPRDAGRLGRSGHVSGVRREHALQIPTLELVDHELSGVGDRQLQREHAIDGISHRALRLGRGRRLPASGPSSTLTTMLARSGGDGWMPVRSVVSSDIAGWYQATHGEQ